MTPWKLESHEIKRGRPVAARANFIAESTASAPVLAKNTASNAGGRRRVELFGEHSGQRRIVKLHAVDEVRVERRAQDLAHVGMVMPEAREALARVEVEIRPPRGVVQIRPLGRDVLLVEAEDPEHVDERSIEVPGGQFQRLVGAAPGVGDDTEWVPGVDRLGRRDLIAGRVEHRPAL